MTPTFRTLLSAALLLSFGSLPLAAWTINDFAGTWGWRTYNQNLMPIDNTAEITVEGGVATVRLTTQYDPVTLIADGLVNDELQIRFLYDGGTMTDTYLFNMTGVVKLRRTPVIGPLPFNPDYPATKTGGTPLQPTVTNPGGSIPLDPVDPTIPTAPGGTVILMPEGTLTPGAQLLVTVKPSAYVSKVLTTDPSKPSFVIPWLERISGTMNELETVVGKPLIMTAVDEPTPLPVYQWYRNGVAIPGQTSGALTLANPGGADSGTYKLTATANGNTLEWAIKATFHAKPEVTAQPTEITVVEGQPFTLTATATSTTSQLSYQWFREGTAIWNTYNSSFQSAPNSKSATHTDADATSEDAGEYWCEFSNEAGTVHTQKVTVTVQPPTRLTNLSTRVMAGGSAGTPVCGFVIKPGPLADFPLYALLRVVGPSLRPHGLANVLPQPSIEITAPSGTKTLITGQSPGIEAAMNAVGAFPLVQDALDAATTRGFKPGSYTGVVRDTTDGSGVVLLELYDQRLVGSKATLANASTRGYVGTEDRVMIPGFTVTGPGTLKLLVRAVGPTLKAYGVNDALTDPIITVFRGQTELGKNDNWSEGAEANAIREAAQAVGAFSLADGSKDAVVLLSLQEGTYTAQVSGVGGATGTALMELYVVP